MKARHLLNLGFLLGALGAPLAADTPLRIDSEQAASSAPAELDWNARCAEHLWNRAGFGATEAEIERAVAMGHSAFVAELLARRGARDEFMPDHIQGRARVEGPRMRLDKDLSERERASDRRLRRDADRRQAADFTNWWVERMLQGHDPLGERMTLFWHGHFTSSMSDVRNSYAMILQNELFREQGMGRFGPLLRAIARDPAMLEYLDNRSNVKESPNENFARELLELFTLGEGNYTEKDIKEAARAFTGWTERRTEFVLRKGEHDFGPKAFMGRKGKFGGEEVLDIVLEQEQCARFVAGKLIAYFEGQEPSAERLEEYTRSFRESDLHVGQLLEKLFMDPEFYREEVIGGRIASPIDFMVGNARRLELDTPELVNKGAGLLGQRLFDPPNVKGWDGGADWISSSTVFHRGNLSGILLGEVSMGDFLDYDPLMDPEVNSMNAMGEGSMSEASEMQDSSDMMGEDEDARLLSRREKLGEMRGLRELRGKQYNPRLRLSAHVIRDAVSSDAELVESMTKRLLGVSVGSETLGALTRELHSLRLDLQLEFMEFLSDPIASEPALRALAHLILSLPEAQLN